MKKVFALLIICIVPILSGCYSFTGGSVPDHIKTIYIAPVADNSGYGNPRYAQLLATELTDKFSRENAISPGDMQSDAKILVTITSIRDETAAVKPGEVESQRKVTVSCSAEYYDAVNKKSFWKKTFSQFENYDVANIQTARDAAIEASVKSIADEILIAVVSGW